MNYLGGSNGVGFEINKFVNAGKTSLEINWSEIMDKIPLLLSTQVGQFEIFCFSLHEGKIKGILCIKWVTQGAGISVTMPESCTRDKSDKIRSMWREEQTQIAFQA